MYVKASGTHRHHRGRCKALVARKKIGLPPSLFLSEDTLDFDNNTELIYISDIEKRTKR
jgi:hypothetical protein